MIDMPDGSHIHVDFSSIELVLCHYFFLLIHFEPIKQFLRGRKRQQVNTAIPPIPSKLMIGLEYDNAGAFYHT